MENLNLKYAQSPPTVAGELEQLSFVYVNTQPFIDFPVVEELVHKKMLAKATNESERNAKKLRFFGGITAALEPGTLKMNDVNLFKNIKFE